MSFPDKSKNPGTGTKKSSSPKKNASPSKVDKVSSKDNKLAALSGAKKTAAIPGNPPEVASSSVNASKLPELVAPTSPGAKSDRPHKSAGWKTSKLFSRTMSSIDVLRAFKKTTQQPNEDLEMRIPLKTRVSNSLKKKTSGGGANQDVMILVSAEESGDSQQAVLQPEAVKKNRSSSQDEGIVCKKEDLLFLIEASKRRPSQTSPTSSRTSSLNEAQSLSLDDKPPPSPTKTISPKQGTSRANSSEKEPPEQLLTEKVEEKDENQQRVMCDSSVIAEGQSIDERSDVLDESSVNPEDETISKVQWDDGNFVDAMMIGDAIEAFLRGSLVPVPNNEKRVSFEKT